MYIIIILAFLLTAFLVFSVLEILYARIYNRPLIVNTAVFLKKLPPDELKYVEENNLFYRSLSPRKKRLFEHRLIRFAEHKTFIGMNPIKVSREMELLISGTAVMITFGMRRYRIRSVKKIIVYPSSYYSQINDQYHIGEFNPAMKIIVFSWEDFMKGYLLENDNMNLGIHEFAHALNYSSMRFRDTSSILFSNGIFKMRQLLNREAYRERLKNSSYLREYAYTNIYEFFAVCLEHYVETPEVFKKELPVLYKTLKRMLNYEFLKA
ncbi:hypothetical protein GWK08_03270 [Leptobacterium flavescens]|uniref:Zinc-dependent peptidase n=1 Tax=Leptobacterium flavescens TaxID=472055 RepID=A0A6P0UKN1_9FLAO|nr:zinc-dependent peptidase [Leptobacterium flavescens]NER12448.1 hypothetical protein [Leptobacterium flavescens]